MVSTPKAPKAPDPTQTAAAQTATNVDTAIANAGLSHTNQYTPDGSLEYRVTGYTPMTDQTGKTYQLWLQNPAGQMVDAGLLSGSGRREVVLRGDASDATAAGITVEPAGGSETPTLPVACA